VKSAVESCQYYEFLTSQPTHDYVDEHLESIKNVVDVPLILHNSEIITQYSWKELVATTTGNCNWAIGWRQLHQLMAIVPEWLSIVSCSNNWQLCLRNWSGVTKQTQRWSQKSNKTGTIWPPQKEEISCNWEGAVPGTNNYCQWPMEYQCINTDKCSFQFQHLTLVESNMVLENNNEQFHTVNQQLCQVTTSQINPKVLPFSFLRQLLATQSINNYANDIFWVNPKVIHFSFLLQLFAIQLINNFINQTDSQINLNALPFFYFYNQQINDKQKGFPCLILFQYAQI